MTFIRKSSVFALFQAVGKSVQSVLGREASHTVLPVKTIGEWSKWHDVFTLVRQAPLKSEQFKKGIERTKNDIGRTQISSTSSESTTFHSVHSFILLSNGRENGIIRKKTVTVCSIQAFLFRNGPKTRAKTERERKYIESSQMEDNLAVVL